MVEISNIKRYTTYQDVKKRTWVLVDFDYWGLHETKQELPQRVTLYRVGSTAEFARPTYGEFIKSIEKNQMQLIKQ